MMGKKRIKTQIWVGCVVKAKVGDMEDNTREGISWSKRRDRLGCVQAVVGKNKFLVKFEYGQKK